MSRGSRGTGWRMLALFSHLVLFWLLDICMQRDLDKVLLIALVSKTTHLKSGIISGIECETKVARTLTKEQIPKWSQFVLVICAMIIVFH